MHFLDKLEKRTTILQKHNDQRGILHHMELKGPISSRMKFKNEEYIIWCLNDYLGLMNNSDAIKAATKVTGLYGPSYPHSVRMTIGHSSSHNDLEKELSEFMDKEDAMLVNLGYQGFFSIIDALTDRHDTIIYDQKSHACLMDGIRLHNGQKFAFKHNDMEHFEIQLQRAMKKHNPDLGIVLIVVDGLYSMHGELAPLDQIVALKEKYGFTLFVDDSHAFGVFGKNGKGSPEHFNVQKEVDVYVSTFTKALGNLGGFVSADSAIIDYLRYATRSQIFSRTLPLPMVKSVQENLAKLRSEPERRERLWSNTHFFHRGLKKIGIPFGNAQGPITPIMINGELKVGLEVLRDLLSMRIFSYIVTYPVVERGKCLIRMVCTHNHSKADIEQTLAAFQILKEKYLTALTESL